MKLKQAQRQETKLRIGLSGASGFGKTYSALLMAYGITEDWSKIAVIDTENGSANLYAELGPYKTLSLQAPYSPERYIEALRTAENASMKVIIIDSITHEWNGKGGCLDQHEKLGGRFQDWAKITPRHQEFLDAILNSKAHIITTVRRKVDYALDRDRNGKTKVVKLGTKEITREGFEYELTLNFELINDNHLAVATKDRTGLFMNRPEFVITSSTGKILRKWCEKDNKSDYVPEAILAEIKSCMSIEGLRHIYGKYSSISSALEKPLLSRKQELEERKTTTKASQNGIYNTK